MTDKERRLLVAIAEFLLAEFPDPVLPGNGDTRWDQLQAAIDNLE